MEPYLYQAACQWYDQERKQAKLLERLPGYPAAHHRLCRTQEGLESCLDETARAAFLEYEEARGRMDCLTEEAAFLTGAMTEPQVAERLADMEVSSRFRVL